MGRRPGSVQRGRRVSVNWTLEAEAYNLLVAVWKREGGKRSLSSLVSFAIRQAFTDPLVEAREKARFHQRELMKWVGVKDQLEAERGGQS